MLLGAFQFVPHTYDQYFELEGTKSNKKKPQNVSVEDGSVHEPHTKDILHLQLYFLACFLFLELSLYYL